MNKNFFITESEDKISNLGLLNAKAVSLPLNEADMDTVSHCSFDSCKRQLDSAKSFSGKSAASSDKCHKNPILVDLKDGIFLNLNIDLNLNMDLKRIDTKGYLLNKKKFNNKTKNKVQTATAAAFNRKNSKLTTKENSKATSSQKSINEYFCDYANCQKNFSTSEKLKKHKKTHLRKLLEKMFDLKSEEENSEDSMIKEDFFLDNKRAIKLETNNMNLQSKIDFLM